MATYHYKFCRKGHLQLSDSLNQAKYCGECGAEFVSACEQCGNPLPEKIEHSALTFFDSPPKAPARPDVCVRCGASFPWAVRHSYSKHGDFEPEKRSFLAGEFSRALKAAVNAANAEPSSVSMYISFKEREGIGRSKHGASFLDLNEVVEPGQDLSYMELNFNDADGRRFSLTGSFSVKWWLAIDAENPESLAAFWAPLQERFRFRTPAISSCQLPSDLTSAEQDKQQTQDAAQIIRLVESKLRTAVRKEPDNEKDVQDILEVLLMGAEVNFSRELVTISYSSRSYRPDFAIDDSDLAIEVKFCTTSAKEREIVQEINDDILAYRTKFSNLLFVVYDLGCIRDIGRFVFPFTQQKGVHVKVIKH